MKTMISGGGMKTQRPLLERMGIVVLVAAVILLVPLVAMQFTDEVAWTSFDFVVAGLLLVGTGFTYELFARKLSNTRHKTIFGVVLAIAFLLVWVELAVGIVGS